MKSPSTKWLGFGAAVAILLAAGVAYAGAWALFEADGVRRGSVSYVLGVPRSVKRLPVLQACATPLYRWRGRDGESAPFVEMSYSTRAGAEDLVNAYSAALAPAACRLVRSESEGRQTRIHFECGGDDFLSASMQMTAGSPCASVELSVTENF